MKAKVAQLYTLALLTSLTAASAVAQMPPAQETPQALPAAAENAAPKPDWMQYKSPYSGEYRDLSKPHRTTYEVSTWAQETVADILSFSPKDYQERLKNFKKYFVKEGWIKYAQYLQSSNTLAIVGNEGYSVSALVNSQPEIINQGATDEVYHWIIKMPVTISFFFVNDKDEIKTRSADPYILYMDLVRTQGDSNAAGAGDLIAIYDLRIDSLN